MNVLGKILSIVSVPLIYTRYASEPAVSAANNCRYIHSGQL